MLPAKDEDDQWNPLWLEATIKEESVTPSIPGALKQVHHNS